jgi:cell division protein ZapA
MNIVTIKINGNEYNLKGDEKEEYLHMVASYVDKKIKNIMSKNEKLSTSSAAILTALNLGDDMFKSHKLCKELSNKTELLDKQAMESLAQLEDFKKQLNHMESYNEELLNKCKNIENGDQVKILEQENIRIGQENIEMRQELEAIKESNKISIEENIKIKTENKEIKFDLQSSKYKIIDLQNKLVEYQIILAKQRKISNPLLTRDKK